MKLDKKTINQVWKKVKLMKRYGWKLTDKTVVMQVEVMKEGKVDRVQDVTYKNIKKYLRKI